uniref:Uncharacterized protein n=1 Tax=Parascaris univalens TaxID=6257 RepID=A0A914ZJX9_PARUN
MAVSLPTGQAAQSRRGSLLLEDEEQPNVALVSVDQLRSGNFCHHSQMHSRAAAI